MDLLECDDRSESSSTSRSATSSSVVSSSISMAPPATSLLQGMEGTSGMVWEVNNVKPNAERSSPSLHKLKEVPGMAYTIRSSCFQVTLDNREVWERFYSWGTEMIVTKAGRRMFPYCHYKVRGLDPHSLYLMAIDVVPVEGHRYRWGEGCWMPVEWGRPQLPNSIYLHQEGVAPGSFWMHDSISFSEVKLTNTSVCQDGVIALTPMFKYVPRFHIIRASKVPRILQLDTDNVHTFVFPQTEFFAVSAYQNTAITHLKINHGPVVWGAEQRSGVLRQDEGEGGGDDSSALDARQDVKEGVSAGSSGERYRPRMVETDNGSCDTGRREESVGLLEEDGQSETLTSTDGVKRNRLKRVDCSKVCNDQNNLFDINKVKEEPDDTWPELVKYVDPQSSLAREGDLPVVLQKTPSGSDYVSPPANSACTSNSINKVGPTHAGAATIVPTVEKDKNVRFPASHSVHPLQQALFPFVCLKRCSVTKPIVNLSELPASMLYSYSFPRILRTRSACGDRPLVLLLSESPPHCSERMDDVKPIKRCFSEDNRLDASGIEDTPEESPSPLQPLQKTPRSENEAFSTNIDETPEDVKPTQSELDKELLNLTSVQKNDAKKAMAHPDVPKGEYVSSTGKSVLPALKVGHTGFSSWVWTPPTEGNTAAFLLPPPSFSSVSSRSGSLCSRSRTPSPTPGSSQPRGRRALRGLAWEASAADTAAASHNVDGEHQADRVDVEGVSFFSFSNKEALLAHRNMEQEKMETPRLSPTLSDNSAEHVLAGRAQERIQRLQDTLQSALSQFQKNKANDESGGDPRFVSRTGKTNDITKIKGWQHKFGLQAPASSSGSASAPETSMLVKNRSVFLSDKLDEYLQEEEKLLEQRPNMYASKAAGVTFQTPRTGSTYVRTLDSVLRRRVGLVPSPVEKEAFGLGCATSPPQPPLPSPLPLSSTRQKRGILAGRGGKASMATLRTRSQKPLKRGTRGKRSGRGGRYGGRGGSSYGGRGGSKYGGQAETVATIARLPSPKLEPLISSLPPTPPSVKSARSCAISGTALVKNANSRNVNAMLLALEELASAQGKPRTYITTDRAELALATLLTPQMTVRGIGMKKLFMHVAAATKSTCNDSPSISVAGGRCRKEFCRLGCVCDSLGEGRAVPAHCGRPKCMLECSCPPQARHQASLPVSKHSGTADGTEAEDEPFGRHKRQKRLPTRLSGTHILYDDISSDCYAFWKLTGRKGHKRKLEGAENTEIHKKRPTLWSDMNKSSRGKLDRESSDDVNATVTQPSKATLPPTAIELQKEMEDKLFAWAAEGSETCARVREYKSLKPLKANLQCTCGKPHCVEKGRNKSNGKFSKEDKGKTPKDEILESQSCKMSTASEKEFRGISNAVNAVHLSTPIIQTGSLSLVPSDASTVIPAISPSKHLLHPSGLPQSNLIEIVSDCNWESERTRVLSAIAEYSGGQSSGETTTLQLEGFQLEISHLENKNNFHEKRDPSTTVSYVSGLPSHKCCSRVRITKNPKLSSAISAPTEGVALTFSPDSGDGSSEEQCQEMKQLQQSLPQSQASSPPQEEQKRLLQALNKTGKQHVHNELQKSKQKLNVNQQEQTEMQDAKKQDEQLESQRQQLKVAQCRSEPQNWEIEHELQSHEESSPPHLQAQQPEDNPKQQYSEPQHNEQQPSQQSSEKQQNPIHQPSECKQELEWEVLSEEELKSVNDSKPESTPPEKTIVPSSPLKVEMPPTGSSAVSKGGSVNKTLFLTTAAAQAVFNSGAKGVNLIQMNGNFIPQAKLVVGPMAALPTVGPVEKQPNIIPIRNVTVHGHSPFVQVNGNLLTHTKLLVGQMGSLQAIGQNIGTSPLVGMVPGPSPVTNLAFHPARRLVTTPLTPVSITLPDGSVAVPTSGSNTVTHLIVNKMGTLVAGQPLPKAVMLTPTSVTSKSAASNTHLASGEATTPGASDATVPTTAPEATDGSVEIDSNVGAAVGPEAAGGAVTHDGPAAAGKPVADDDHLSAACVSVAADDPVAAGEPVEGVDPVATNEPAAPSGSSAADGSVTLTDELEPADRLVASGETSADPKDLPPAPAGLTMAMTPSAAVPVVVPITATTPFPSGTAIPISLGGRLKLPPGIPFVHKVSTEPQRLLFIPMQPPVVRPTAPPVTINPIRLPAPSPMLLPGQRMVLQPVKGTNRMQLYRHPSGQLVQLVPVRSARPPVGTTSETPKPPTLTLRTGLVVHTLNPTGLGLQMRPTGAMLTVARTEPPQVISIPRAPSSSPPPQNCVEMATVEASTASVCRTSPDDGDGTVAPSSEAASEKMAENVLSGGPMTTLEMCLVEATNNAQIRCERKSLKERHRLQTSSSVNSNKMRDEEDSESSKSESVTTAARETTQSMDESTETSSDEDSEVDVENLSEGEVSGITYTEKNVDVETVGSKMEENLTLLKTRMAQKESTNSQCVLHNPNSKFSNQQLSDSSDSDDDILKEVRPNRSGLMRSLQLQDLIALKLLNVPMDEFYDPNASLHTVNERRRRSELRDLFKNMKVLLGFPAHTKMSKYALLQQAHSEIQHLEEQRDRMIGEKNDQLRRRDALLRKVVAITHKKEDVIIRKLEYICAKHRIKEKLKLAAPQDLDQLDSTYIVPSNQPVRGRPRKIAPKPSMTHSRKQSATQPGGQDQTSSLQTPQYPPPPPLESQPVQRKPRSKPKSKSWCEPEIKSEPDLQPSVNDDIQMQSKFQQQPKEELQVEPQAESQPEAESESQPETESESQLRLGSESPQLEPELQSQPQFQCEPQPQPEPQPESNLSHLQPQLEVAAPAVDNAAATTTCAPAPAYAMTPPLRSCVRSQANRKPSAVRNRPLILTRKRTYSAETHELSAVTSAWSTTTSSSTSVETPVHVTSDGLLMTPHGQVLTLKGKVLPSHSTPVGSPIIMAQGVLQGKPLAPKGQDKSNASVPGIASVTIRLQCVNVAASGANTAAEALEHKQNSSSDTVSTTADSGTRLVPSSLSAFPVCSPAATAAVEASATVSSVAQSQRLSESPAKAPAGESSSEANKEEAHDKSSLSLMEITKRRKRDDAEDPDVSELLKIVSVTSLADERSNERSVKGDAVSPFTDRVSNIADLVHESTVSGTVGHDDRFSSLALVMSSDTDATDEDNIDTSTSDVETKDPVQVSLKYPYGDSTINCSPSSALVPPDPAMSSASASGHGLSKDICRSTQTSTRTISTKNSLHTPSHRATQPPSTLPRSGCINAAIPRGTIPCSVRLPNLPLSQQAQLALQAKPKCVTGWPSKPTTATGPQAFSSSQVVMPTKVAAPTRPLMADDESYSVGVTKGMKEDVRPMPQLLQMQQPKLLRHTLRVPRPLPPLSRLAIKLPATSSSPLDDETPANQICSD